MGATTGSQYILKPSAWEAVDPQLRGISGDAAGRIIAKLQQQMSEAEAAFAAAARTKWGQRLLTGAKYGSRVLLVVGVGISVYEVVTADNPYREACGEVGGWAGALSLGAGGAAIGASLGPPGIVVGGILGGVVGFLGGEAAGEAVYDAMKTGFVPENPPPWTTPPPPNYPPPAGTQPLWWLLGPRQ